MTLRGVGPRRPAVVVDEECGTWILHLTSSTGVRTRDVKAPDMAPVSHSAESGSGFSRWYIPDRKNVSRATRSQKKSELVSRAAPTRGALIPRYSPINPSVRNDCLKQSTGPAYLKGR